MCNNLSYNVRMKLIIVLFFDFLVNQEPLLNQIHNYQLFLNEYNCQVKGNAVVGFWSSTP